METHQPTPQQNEKTHQKNPYTRGFIRLGWDVARVKTHVQKHATHARTRTDRQLLRYVDGPSRLALPLRSDSRRSDSTKIRFGFFLTQYQEVQFSSVQVQYQEVEVSVV